MAKTKLVPMPPGGEACRIAMADAMRPYADKLGPEGMLAVAAALVGQLMALQDQRTMTPVMAMDIVDKNIENANHEMTDALRKASGGNA